MKHFILTGMVTLAMFSPALAADGLYGTVAGWGQMVDPDGDSRFEVGRNQVTITFGPSPKGLDAEGGPSRMNAPRVLASVDHDFSVSTIVKGNLPLPELPYAYISGGLVLMQDERSYLRLERANFIRNGSKSFYTNFEQRIDAQRTRMGRFADFPLDRHRDVELRLEVHGDTVRGLVRHVGDEWHEMGTAKIDPEQVVQVGISGVKTIEDEVAVIFTDFRIHREGNVEAADSSEIDLSPPEQTVAPPMVQSPALMKLIPKINELQSRSGGIEEMSDVEMNQLIEDAKAIAGEQIDGIPPTFGAGIAQGLAERFRRAGKGDLAVRVYREIADVVSERDTEDENVKTAVERLRRLAEQLETRLQMIGKPIHVTGKLLTGEMIDWSQYTGKVVLVDYWASWCGPCRREIPNIKQQLAAYGSKGFAVVGVCLDRDREPAEQYIESAEITWPSIFDQEAQGESMADRYSITAIPTAILVDRDGNVVSLEARGEALPALLNELLGEPTEVGDEQTDQPEASLSNGELGHEAAAHGSD